MPITFFPFESFANADDENDNKKIIIYLFLFGFYFLPFSTQQRTIAVVFFHLQFYLLTFY